MKKKIVEVLLIYMIYGRIEGRVLSANGIARKKENQPKEFIKERMTDSTKLQMEFKGEKFNEYFLTILNRRCRKLINWIYLLL